MNIDHLATRLNAYRFRFVTEKDLQDGIEAMLTAEQIPFQRERAISAPDRPDFLVDGNLAVEVKIKGSLAQLLRQASRYASHPEIAGIVVVGSPRWLATVPSVLCDKPVKSVRLLGSLL